MNLLLRFKIWKQFRKRSSVTPAISDKWDLPVKDKKVLAREIVGYSVLVRKSEQSVNPESLLWVALLVLIFGFFFWRVNQRIEKAEAKAALRATVMASGGNMYDIGGLADLAVGPTRTPTFTVMEAAAAYVQATMQASWTVTPSPTSTPANTSTPAIVSEPVFLKLSFYDPMIGQFFPDIASVNCATWSVDLNTCLSTMADGQPFANYYGRAVACPPPMQNGDVLDVVYPVQLQGRWTCMDRGWAIERGYIDFLLRYPDMVWSGHNLNQFPWGSTVQATWTHP